MVLIFGWETWAITYTSTDKPERIGKFNVQSIKDNFFRKGNSVLSSRGASEHRKLKDSVDFVTISRLMLDTKQLQSEAELKRVHIARKSLEQVKQKVRKLPGYNAKEYPLNRDPISDSRKKQFIDFSVSHPSKDVREIYIQNGKVKTTQKKTKKLVGLFDPNNKAWNYWKQ